jgi:PIN domain nuclease of toxin-antitoxin system
MRLLLDTHALLWFLREPEKLPPDVLQQIESAGPDSLVSLGSLWEIAIKSSLKKLYLPKEFDELFPQSVTESGLSLLGIEPRHINALSRLPWHHRDPFDRLLIAQCQVDQLQLVSRDPEFVHYEISLIWH